MRFFSDGSLPIQLHSIRSESVRSCFTTPSHCMNIRKTFVFRMLVVRGEQGSRRAGFAESRIRGEQDSRRARAAQGSKVRGEQGPWRTKSAHGGKVRGAGEKSCAGEQGPRRAKPALSKICAGGQGPRRRAGSVKSKICAGEQGPRRAGFAESRVRGEQELRRRARSTAQESIVRVQLLPNSELSCPWSDDGQHRPCTKRALSNSAMTRTRAGTERPCPSASASIEPSAGWSSSPLLALGIRRIVVGVLRPSTRYSSNSGWSSSPLLALGIRRIVRLS